MRLSVCKITRDVLDCYVNLMRPRNIEDYILGSLEACYGTAVNLPVFVPFHLKIVRSPRQSGR